MQARLLSVITPRHTRLHRAPDSQSFLRAVAELVPAGPAARRTAVIAATSAAAAQLRQSLENIIPRAITLPAIVSRDEWYASLHERLPQAAPRLADVDREVMLRSAASEAIQDGAEPPFRLRPGLIAEMLAFYDALRRQHRTVEAFERLLAGTLEPSVEIDRGARRLLQQTRFLAAAFRAFERKMAACPCLDEHGIRALASSTPLTLPLEQVIVTVADRAADPFGLWPADFDLLTRMPGLQRVDVIATEHLLATGFHERVSELLPGLEEIRAATASSAQPVLVIPSPEEGGGNARWFVSRDREEELVAVARMMKDSERAGDRFAVVFQNPLPYLYLARKVFDNAGIAYQTFDALPLAAEPAAAAFDLVCTFVTSGFTRASTVALLRSPHFSFGVEERDVGALDVALSEGHYHGGRDDLVRLVDGWDAAATGRHAARLQRAVCAGRAALEAADELASLAHDAPAGEHLDTLLGFLRRHQKGVRPLFLDDAEEKGAVPLFAERQLRAHAAIHTLLVGLRDAHARYDQSPIALPDVVAMARRWIEAQTFTPRSGERGIQLLDARAARYADVDEIRIVGLVEDEWPDRSARNIFYTPHLLGQLGWAGDAPHLAAERAAFRDLLSLPRERVSLSTFTLENDALASASQFLDETGEIGLSTCEQPVEPLRRIFVREALTSDSIVPGMLTTQSAEWLSLRASRTSGDDEAFHGKAGGHRPEAHAVSAVEQYLVCPFKYFAKYVLDLEEEVDEEPTLMPQARGRFLHDVFQAFFAEWQQAGRGAITPRTLARAIDEFAAVAERQLARLPATDRAIERTRLLGSAAAAGLGERVLRIEAGRRTELLERLLERSLDGEVELAAADGKRRIRVRGTADRIDLLADRTLRLLDYKSGRAPKRARAIQLPVYGAAAVEHLEGYRGHHWRLVEAGYVALGGPYAFVAVNARNETLDRAIEEGQRRFVGTIDRIAAGEFPVTPDEPFLCTLCPYPSVCRKDYVGDE